jgi:hypothetical protein
MGHSPEIVKFLVEAGDPREVRELQRELCQKAKRELQKPIGIDIMREGEKGTVKCSIISVRLLSEPPHFDLYYLVETVIDIIPFRDYSSYPKSSSYQ